MARQYHIICSICKVFLDLHKFQLVPSVCDQSPLGIQGVAVNVTDISGGISQVEPRNQTNYWIHELIPQVERFAQEHSDHVLRLVDDCEPDYLWWPEHKGYTEWKETPGYMTHDYFLPRNLIDDLGITDWETAEEYLKTTGEILYEELELTEYKTTFGVLTEHSNTKKFG